MTQEQLLTGDEIQKEIATMEKSISKLMLVDFFNNRSCCGTFQKGESFLDSLEADVKKHMIDKINAHISELEEKFKAL